MIIYRDGQAIELTREECRKVYEELDAEYRKEDVQSRLESMEYEFDDSDLDVLEDRVYQALGKNDSYWDSYWGTVEYVIEEYMEDEEE